MGRPRILEWVAIPSPGDLPNLGIEPGSPLLQAENIFKRVSAINGRKMVVGWLVSHMTEDQFESVSGSYK